MRSQTAVFKTLLTPLVRLKTKPSRLTHDTHNSLFPISNLITSSPFRRKTPPNKILVFLLGGSVASAAAGSYIVCRCEYVGASHPFL